MIHQEPWYREAEDDRTRQQVLRGQYDALPRLVQSIYRKGDWHSLEKLGRLLVNWYLEIAVGFLPRHPGKPTDTLMSISSYLAVFHTDLTQRILEWQREDAPHPSTLWEEYDWETLYGKILKVLPYLQDLDKARAYYKKDNRTIFDFLKAEGLLS